MTMGDAGQRQPTERVTLCVCKPPVAMAMGVEVTPLAVVTLPRYGVMEICPMDLAGRGKPMLIVVDSHE